MHCNILLLIKKLLLSNVIENGYVNLSVKYKQLNNNFEVTAGLFDGRISHNKVEYKWQAPDVKAMTQFGKNISQSHYSQKSTESIICY